MPSVGGTRNIRITGLASGIDTETMIKDMLAGEQKKIDKVKQKQQTIKWQQEIYRDVMKDVKELQGKYLSVTSPNSIVKGKSWSTINIKSSNEEVITATGSASANDIDYKVVKVKKATSAAIKSKITPPTTTSSSVDLTNKIVKRSMPLSEMGLKGDVSFKIKFGDDEKQVSETIKLRTADLKSGKEILEHADTIDSLVRKINDSTDGTVKAMYSEMTGEFILENTKTGEKSQLLIVDETGKNPSDALEFMGIKKSLTAEKGSGSEVIFETKDGIQKKINQESNFFTIDGVTYDIHGDYDKPTEGVKLTSSKDTQGVVDNMKNFIEDYNKLMDKTYKLLTQKKKRDFQPLTEEQKKDMSKEEIEKWEKKAKEGLLRSDPEMTKFMDHMQNAIFGDDMKFLIDCGLTSHKDYNKKGQLALDEDKFKKALEKNSQHVYEKFAGGKDSVLEKMKNTMSKYVGTSSSIFAKKAGIENTVSALRNLYSDQIKRQEDSIRLLQKKMDTKENKLYKQFAKLEESMNKLNSQMSYFSQM